MMYFTIDKLQIHYSEVRDILAEAIKKSPDNDNVIKLRAGFHYIMNHLVENEIRLNRAESQITHLSAQLREELKKTWLSNDNNSK
jgi:hypothetical protein